MAAAGEAKHPALQPTQSCHSHAGTASSFVTACPAGRLDPLGLPPVAKVFVRPASSQRVKKPSALDKHLRHVVLLQRSNRQRARQHAADAQHKQHQHQRFANWGHRLRNAILGRGHSSNSSHSSSDKSSSHGSPEPAQPVTAPAAPAYSPPQHLPAQPTDVLQSWRPVAAAAQTRELQDRLAVHQQQLRSSLPAVLDPDTLGPDIKERQRQLLQEQEQQQRQRQQQQQQQQEGSLDVDAFLDGLLHTAAAAATGCPAPAAAKGSSPALSPAKPAAQQTNTQNNKPRPSSSCSSRAGGRPVPAWAVSEQQAAAAEAAAADAEEASLLQFAEGLDWQELLRDLGDAELADAFKELERADAAAAEGRPDAERRWQACFVTALNAAAMKGIADSSSSSSCSTAAGGAGAGAQGDTRSFVSSASAARRAEATAARRQQLIHRLHRLAGTQPGTSAAGEGSAAAAAGVAGSVCGSTGSRLGSVGGGFAGLAAGAGAGGADSWDSSTVVSSSAEDVGRVQSALQHLEAGVVLAENPDLKGVHSAASVRSMLSRMEVA